MDISNLLVELFEKMSVWENNIVKDSGLSLPHMHTLEMIGIHRRLMMKDLATFMGVTTGTLTVTVDKLENKGLVTREPNPNDRRSWMIVLTEEGRRYHQEHTEAHTKMTKRCLEGFSAKEQEALQGYLSRFVGNFPISE